VIFFLSLCHCFRRFFDGSLKKTVCLHRVFSLLGKTAAETVTMLREAFKGEALSQARVYEWFSRFERGDMSLEDQPRSGRPSTSRTDENVKKIRDTIMFDRRRTIDELQALTGVSWSSCQRILTELHMKRIAAKFVPRLLSEDQGANRLDVICEMKDQLKTDADFLSKIITGDESWCYGYDPETKQQSSQWKSASSPRPKKARQVKSNVKSILICFFDIKGFVHFEFVPQGQTANQQFYLELLKRLRDAVRRKRPELWRSGEWLLHHDSAPAHTALSVRQFLTKNGMTTASKPPPPHPPTLEPCDFFLLPRMKRDLKGKCFQNLEEVRKK